MNYKTKLKEIKNFIFDVDGVFTNNTVMVFQNEFVRTLNARDSYAVQYASKLGYRIFIITGGESTSLKKALLHLGVTEVYLASSNKLEVFRTLQSQYPIEAAETLYMGDDIPDIPLLNQVHLPCCPFDASIDVRQVVSYVSPKKGGEGCVRDVIEQTLRVQENWLKDNAYTW
jgi:3-deoxy-D-manno-octulosonate 8-phosphate phosphatase (KDO 8-P phosphatase)